MFKLTFFILMFSLSTLLYGQTLYEVGILPEVNIGKKINELWNINVEFAPRFELSKGDFKGDNDTDVFYSLLDVTTVATRTVGVDAKVGAGYLARFRDKKLIHRAIQQYSFTVPYFGFRLGHRFRTDQTFSANQKAEFRARYRLSSDISLNGEFIDPREVYLKLGNEYVYSLQGDATDLEVRFVPTLGYFANDTNKLEIGVDYRMDSFLDATANHRFWINLGYYMSL